MITKIINRVKHHIRRPFFVASAFSRELLKDEATSGKLVIAFSIIAIILVNTPLTNFYYDFWHTTLSLGIGSFSLEMDLKHWVSEGLMTIFFLVVGLEIKREIVNGELKYFKKAVLPIAAAIGGMIVPALIFIVLNTDPTTVRGWGIPMATDIAFAVAVLSLLGNRVPITLKLFLLTLSVVDDIGAIFVIALFYAEIINYAYLLLAGILLIFMFMARNILARQMLIFSVFGILLWLVTHLSGIHASIVGAFLGLIAPTINVGRSNKSLVQRLEELYLPISTFIVLPVFALASAGIVFSASNFSHNFAINLSLGITLGLVIGKLLGVAGASWLMVKLKYAQLPKEVNWYHITGVSLIAGTGFTVSIFITELAFAGDPILLNIGKISIFIGSILAATLGSMFLIKAKRIQKFVEEIESDVDKISKITG